MTSMPEQDPFVSLWQSASQPDTRNLVRELKHLHRLHRRQNRVILTIVCGIAFLLVFEELTGRLPSHGLISVIWVAGVISGVVWNRRARINRLDGMSSNTAGLLKAMISHAKRDLFVARCLYGGVPFGAIVGYFALLWVGVGSPQLVRTGHPLLHMVQTGAGIAALALMMGAGIALARSRSRQVRELTDKLEAAEMDM